MIIENLPIGRNIVHLSKHVRSDASALVYGTIAPTGSDPTARIQGVIDRVPTGGTLVWDIAVGISAPIYIPSNITIHAPGREFGAILRAESNCPMFRNAGIATDSTTDKQKTFGKLDPAYPGDQRYRVLDPVNFMNDRNITISGGTWNGNRQEQTGYPFTDWGFNSVFQLWGVENLLVENLLILNPLSALPFHIINWHKVRIVGCEVDCSPISGALGGVNTSAAFQVQGPGRFMSIIDPITHASDDHIAFNCDDSGVDLINATYAAGIWKCAPGVNWACGGDITDVYVSNHQISNGTENVISSGCMRFLTSVHTIDRVIIDGQSGTTRMFGYTIGAIEGMLIPGTGNIGNIDFLNCKVEILDPAVPGLGKGLFEIQSNVEQIRILNRVRGTVPTSAVADIYVGDPLTGSAVVKSLIVSGDYNEDGEFPVAAPQVEVASRIDQLVINTRRRQRAFDAIAAPVLKTIAGADVGMLEFSGSIEGATNIVEHTAGSINSVILHGSHRKSNGGSPLAIATGLTIKNYWYKDLAFATGIAAKSGAGTVTNDNAYVDAITRNLSNFDGASANLDVYTPDVGGGWTLAGISASSKPVSSAGALTIPSLTTGQEALMVCDATVSNGVITILDVAGNDANTGVGVLFYFADSSNFCQFVFESTQVYWYRIVAGGVDGVGWQTFATPSTLNKIQVIIDATTTYISVNDAVSTSFPTSNFAALNANTKYGIKVFPESGGSGTTTPVTVGTYKFTEE